MPNNVRTNPDVSFIVNDATNATPIVIQTTSAHGLATGYEAVITGVLGNTAANGTWKITVTGADTFSLDGSVGNGAYTALTGSGIAYEWADGFTPPEADWTDLERKVFEGWNGTRGGAYSAPVGSGGSAYVFSGDGLQVTGPTRLTRGGVLYGDAAAFIIRDGTWPQISATHAARARKIVQPIHSYETELSYLWTKNHSYGGVGSVALACRHTFSREIETSDLYVPLRVVDGSTLSEVELHFRVAERRVYAPIAMPKMRVLRVPRNVGEVVDGVLVETEALRAADNGFDFLPIVTSAAAWYADGEAQVFTYECDQNNVIDVENYSYVVHIIEELGAQSPDDEFDGIRFVERKTNVLGVARNIGGITGFYSVEADSGLLLEFGGTLGNAGDRYLVVDKASVIATRKPDPYGFSAMNGIRIGDAGVWPLSSDCDDQGDFTPNWIVIVELGYVNSLACWQCVHPGPTNRVTLGDVASLTATSPRIIPAEPKGNIYHSLVPTFVVTDLRFQ